jgi:hypothetical protein
VYTQRLLGSLFPGIPRTWFLYVSWPNLQYSSTSKPFLSSFPSVSLKSQPFTPHIYRLGCLSIRVQYSAYFPSLMKLVCCVGQTARFCRNSVWSLCHWRLNCVRRDMFSTAFCVNVMNAKLEYKLVTEYFIQECKITNIHECIANIYGESSLFLLPNNILQQAVQMEELSQDDPRND